MTAARLTTVAELGPRFALDGDAPFAPAALTNTFGRRAPRLLDIGVGNGEATLTYAAAHRDHDLIAVELHRPGIAYLLRRLADTETTNVRVIEADVTSVVADLRPGAIDDVRILFPDPWPKARHRKRRLVDDAFVAELAAALPVGGRLHLATDWLDYADQMRVAIAGSPRFRPVEDAVHGADEAGIVRWRSARPDRPITAYERRGLDAGRTITDLVAERVEGPAPS